MEIPCLGGDTCSPWIFSSAGGAGGPPPARHSQHGTVQRMSRAASYQGGLGVGGLRQPPNNDQRCRRPRPRLPGWGRSAGGGGRPGMEEPGAAEAAGGERTKAGWVMLVGEKAARSRKALARRVRLAGLPPHLELGCGDLRLSLKCSTSGHSSLFAPLRQWGRGRGAGKGVHSWPAAGARGCLSSVSRSVGECSRVVELHHNTDSSVPPTPSPPTSEQGRETQEAVRRQARRRAAGAGAGGRGGGPGAEGGRADAEGERGRETGVPVMGLRGEMGDGERGAGLHTLR